MTLNPAAPQYNPNPLLGCAFAAPFAKGNRQMRSSWRGDLTFAGELNEEGLEEGGLPKLLH